MRISASWQQRQITGCLVVLLMAPFAEAAATRPEPVPSSQQAQTAPTAKPQNADSATDTSSSSTSQPETSTSSDAAASSKEISQDQPSDTLPSAPQQQQNGNSNPVGTAAAPYEKTTGVAASRPAGAVVAPAKQKRSRSFLIRVGLVIGACVAVGTIVALSAGSPSRP